MKDKHRQRFNWKKIFSVVVAVLLVISLARMIWDNLEGLRRVKNLRGEIQVLEERNERLRKKIEERKSLTYVEEQARRELGMVKEGERVFIYPDREQESVEEESQGYLEGELCYWREWLNAFGF